jgi:hypothetical protein
MKNSLYLKVSEETEINEHLLSIYHMICWFESQNNQGMWALSCLDLHPDLGTCRVKALCSNPNSLIKILLQILSSHYTKNPLVKTILLSECEVSPNGTNTVPIVQMSSLRPEKVTVCPRSQVCQSHHQG